MRAFHPPLLGCLVTLTVACGSSQLGKPVAEFPSKAKLEELASRTEKPVPALKTTSVDAWQIASPIPAPGAAYPHEDHWDELAATAAAAHTGVRLSAELRCAAREVARFYVEHGAYPDDSLRSFLVARCGSTLPSPQIQVVFSDVPAGVSEAALRASLEKPASELLQRSLAQSTELGFGFAQGNGRATVVALSGKAIVRLQPVAATFSGTTLTLTGQVTQDAGFVTGFVTQGEYGVQFCEPDRSQKLPAFRLDCSVPEQDSEATVELATGKPNRLFWHIAARVQVRRDANAGLAYQSRAIGTDATVAEPRAFSEAFLAGLNQVRTRAGMPALALEGTQSATNERLSPLFFANAMKGNDWLLDEIGLGLLAGWDVSGMIRTGSIYSSLAESSRNPGRFLADALASPFARWVLLEPGMTRVAIGASALGADGVTALVTTYAFFESNDHAGEEAAIIEELSKVRSARGLPKPHRSPSDGALRSAALYVSSNALSSPDALQDALTRISTQRQRSVGGYVLETSDLKHIEFPPELLDPKANDIEVTVTHYRARGGAWGQYVVMFVILGDAPRREAHGHGNARF